MWGFPCVGPLLAIAVGLGFLLCELPLPLPFALAGLRFRLFLDFLIFPITGGFSINKSVGASLAPGSGAAGREHGGGVVFLSAAGRATRPAVDTIAVTVTVTVVVIRECFGAGGTVLGDNWGMVVVGGT